MRTFCVTYRERASDLAGIVEVGGGGGRACSLRSPTRGVRNGALSHKKSFKARPRSHPTTPGHYHKPPPLTKYDHPMWATLIVAFPSFTTPTNLIFRMSLVRFKALIHPQNLLVQATNERFLSAGGTFITIVVRATSERFLPTGGHF